jgi:Nuclease-related domain
VRVRGFWKPQPRAGRSSLAYYEAGLERWRRQIRRALLVFIAFSGLGALLSWLFLPRFGEFFAGLWIGSGIGMAWWVWDDPPEWTAKWKRGATGEHLTEKQLGALEQEGWRTFHDREGAYGNLDHVVVGPGGVFLLDSKNLSGRISVEEDGLTARHSEAPKDSFTYKSLAGSMRGAAATLKERIADVTGVSRWVHGVIVVWGDFPEREHAGDRITYLAGDTLTLWLRKQPERLSTNDRQIIQSALEAGAVAPDFAQPSEAR